MAYAMWQRKRADFSFKEFEVDVAALEKNHLAEVDSLRSPK